MTGPDDSVDPAECQLYSQRFSFVEWGILVSRNQQGFNRFPSFAWMDKLLDIYVNTPFEERGHYSMHVCGGWVRELLWGKDEVFVEMRRRLNMYDRMQINTHGERLTKDVEAFSGVLMQHPDKQFIIQWEHVNGEELLYNALFHGVNAVPLFDCSHGAGVSPSAWPTRLSKNWDNNILYCGYAGGLGPDNIEAELKRIEEVVDRSGKDIPIWIDMETRIRSDNDRKFDFSKVQYVLDVVAPYIK